jgi:predicted transcriptional regulator
MDVDKSGRQLDADLAQAKNDLLQWTSNIVAAYLNKNEIDLRQLPHVLETVYAKLSALGEAPSGPSQFPPFPLALHQSDLLPKPVAIEKSVTPDHIVCLEDGVRLKTLKRYLFRKYRLTPEQYRIKWGLPPDYPMVAPNYAAKRSALAKKMGLGRKRKEKPRGGRKRRQG